MPLSIFAHRETFHIIERHSTCFLLYSILLIQYFLSLSVSHPSTIYFLRLLAHSNFNFFLYCCAKNNLVVKLGNNARSANTKPNHYRKLLYIIYIWYELEKMFRLQSRKDLELPLFLILSSLVNNRIIHRAKECYSQFLQPGQFIKNVWW